MIVPDYRNVSTQDVKEWLADHMGFHNREYYRNDKLPYELLPSITKQITMTSNEWTVLFEKATHIDDDETAVRLLCLLLQTKCFKGLSFTLSKKGYDNMSYSTEFGVLACKCALEGLLYIVNLPMNIVGTDDPKEYEVYKTSCLSVYGNITDFYKPQYELCVFDEYVVKAVNSIKRLDSYVVGAALANLAVRAMPYLSWKMIAYIFHLPEFDIDAFAKYEVGKRNQ